MSDEQAQAPTLSEIGNELRRMSDRINSAILRDSVSDNAKIGNYFKRIHDLVRDRSYATQISFEEGEFEWGGCVEFEDIPTKQLVRIEHDCECESLLALMENLHDLTEKYVKDEMGNQQRHTGE